SLPKAGSACQTRKMAMATRTTSRAMPEPRATFAKSASPRPWRVSLPDRDRADRRAVPAWRSARVERLPLRNSRNGGLRGRGRLGGQRGEAERRRRALAQRHGVREVGLEQGEALKAGRVL